MSDTTKQAEEWIGWARHRTMGQISMGSDPVPLMQDLLSELAAANERRDNAEKGFQIMKQNALRLEADNRRMTITDAEKLAIQKQTAQEICGLVRTKEWIFLEGHGGLIELIKQKYGIEEEGK